MINQKIYGEKLNKLQNAFIELNKRQDKYYESIDKDIEFHLSNLNNSKKTKHKNKDKIKKKEKKYLAQIKLTEELRADFTEKEGYHFYILEEFERKCTNDLKSYIKMIVNNFNVFRKDIEFKESELKLIEEINGNNDIQIFSKMNKSLIRAPKRIVFKHYKIDMNYYMENFNSLKKEIKDKSSEDLKIFSNNISKEVREFINEIIFKETDEIKVRIIDIAKNINENKLRIEEFNYLISKFEENFKIYMDWKNKNNIDGKYYKKVGPDYDNRNSYAQTFVEYFQRIDEENKCLDPENFVFFTKALAKILELNMNEDIDYDLCNIVIILSSKYYMVDKSKKLGKRYSYEIIRNYPVMNKQGFWEGFSRFILYQELIKQKIYKEDNISVDILTNIIIPKVEEIIF